MTQRTTLAAFRRSIPVLALSLALFACSDDKNNGNNDDSPSPSVTLNPSTIKASGDTLLVTLQRLENWAATKPGLLVRIKASTKTVIDTIQLNFYNPSSSVLSNGKLYVSLQGAYNEDYSIDVAKSGIAVVDLATGTSKVLVKGTELGGGAGDIALDEANQILYASVSVSFGNSPVKPIDLAAKTVGDALPNISNASGGLVFDKEGKKLFVGDRSSGLIVYDVLANTTTIVDNQDPLLLPYSLSATNSLLLNFTSDYTTGELRWMDLNSTTLSGALTFNQDSKVYATGENIFFFERNPGTLACISSQNGDVKVITQKRLEADNPYEVAVIGTKGYITLNDANYVQILDVGTCTLSEKIDL